MKNNNHIINRPKTELEFKQSTYDTLTPMGKRMYVGNDNDSYYLSYSNKVEEFVIINENDVMKKQLTKEVFNKKFIPIQMDGVSFIMFGMIDFASQGIDELLIELEEAYKEGERSLDMMVSIKLSGGRQKQLRQDIMKHLTGKNLPKSECGIHMLETTLIEYFKLQAKL